MTASREIENVFSKVLRPGKFYAIRDMNGARLISSDSIMFSAHDDEIFSFCVPHYFDPQPAGRQASRGFS